MHTLKEIRKRKFANGIVYALETHDGYSIEVTDTHLPFYTKDAVGRKQNALKTSDLGDRSQRWMIGVSVMSGCPVGCKFCATGNLKRWRRLTAAEIVAQVEFILSKNPKYKFTDAMEHKINYTRMGEPFLTLDAVKEAIEIIEKKYPGTHHYVSTIGLKNADYSWIRNNITLQVSLHSLVPDRRAWLIPWKNTASLEELGAIKTGSNLKTTLNLTLVDDKDFDISVLKKYFSTDSFFVKLSPINPNSVSEKNELGFGAISTTNLR